MKAICLILVLIVTFSSCCKVVYRTLASTPAASLEKAKKMVENYRTGSGVSHAFDDQIRYFRIDKKAIKKLSRSESSVNFITAAYYETDAADTTKKKNQLTIILQIFGKDEAKQEYVDIRDVQYAKCKSPNKPTMQSAATPTELCPPPKTCKVPVLE